MDSDEESYNTDDIEVIHGYKEVKGIRQNIMICINFRKRKKI